MYVGHNKVGEQAEITSHCKRDIFNRIAIQHKWYTCITWMFLTIKKSWSLPMKN